jgi:DNA-binding NarL/FixJ family response regulator
VPLRVLVADNNDAFLAAARDVLTAAPGLDVVAVVTSGQRVLEACDHHRPDVAVLDVQMPGGGPDLAAEIARRWPATRILCLSARDDADTVLAMLASGATGYVAKGALVEDLAAVVQRTVEGGFFVTAGCAPEVRRRIGELVGRPGQVP